MPIRRALLFTVLALFASARPALAIGQREPLSGDGRYRAHTTRSSTGVTLVDRVTGATERVSADVDGGFPPADQPDLDFSGRHVAFHSLEALLIDDVNGAGDVYVRDRACALPERISIGIGGAQGNGQSHLPAISGDGRHVAYVSRATNLVPGDTNRAADVFVTDRLTGATERVSVDAQGRQSTGGMGDFGIAPSISADGRHVAFNTRSRLTPGDTDDAYDVYVRDVQAATTTRVSVAPAGSTWSGAFRPSISATGRYVAFHSQGSAGDAVWRRDLAGVVTELVAAVPGGVGGGDDAAIAADGSRVAFAAGREIRVHDLDTGTTSAASGSAPRRAADISADGRWASWAEGAAVGGVLEVAGARPVPPVTAFDAPCAVPASSAYRSAVLADGPSGYWRFGELSGVAVARDETGGPHGDLSATAGVPGSLAGDPSTAISLDGAGQQVVVAHEPMPHGRAPFTLEAWIRPRDLNGNTRRVFSSEGAQGGWLLGVRDTGLSFSRHVPGRASTARAPLAAGRWSHVAATFDGTAMRLYVDGEERASAGSSLATAAPGPQDYPLLIGSLRGQWRFFAGELDEAAVYPRALPAARISSHFRTGRGL